MERSKLLPKLKKIRDTAARLQRAIEDLPLDPTPKPLRGSSPGAPDPLNVELGTLKNSIQRALAGVEAVINFKGTPGPKKNDERFFLLLRCYSELTYETGRVPTAKALADRARGGPPKGVSPSGDQVFRDAQEFLSRMKKQGKPPIFGKARTIRGNPSGIDRNIP